MPERLTHLYESIGRRDLIEIALMALVIYFLLRLIGASRGAGLVRGLGIITAGVFLLAQVVVAGFDLTELGRILDYLLLTALLALVIVFQPELRRGLLLLGRYRMLQVLGHQQSSPFVDKLADAAAVLSKDFTGALIAVQRGMSLAAYVNSGDRLDSEVTVDLLVSIFNKHSPLHDGAVIIADGRVAAAACQLPLAEAPEGNSQFGMRHRAALGLSEETDAIVVVVSEETGRVSLAMGGHLEPVPREALARRLATVLHGPLPLAA